MRLAPREDGGVTGYVHTLFIRAKPRSHPPFLDVRLGYDRNLCEHSILWHWF